MARPLRKEFSGALNHIAARRNAQEDIYFNGVDPRDFLNLLQKATERYHWYCLAYFLMSNRYHLLIEKHSPILSKRMKFINGVYTQQFKNAT